MQDNDIVRAPLNHRTRSGLAGTPKREALSRTVASHIRESILGGEIRAGDKLQLVPLAARMGMSVTPVREALLLLSQDGWVMHEVHRGFQVQPMRRTDMKDTYLVMSVVEGELAGRAAGARTDHDVVCLRAIDERLRALEDHRSELASELNADLHRKIHEIAAAPQLQRLADIAIRMVPSRFNESFQRLEGWAELNRWGHKSIIDAIESGDTEEANRLMHDHFIEAGDLLIEQFDEIEFWT